MSTTARIVRKPDTRGGFATIEGTRISVTDIVACYSLDLPEFMSRLAGPPDPKVGCVVPITSIIEAVRVRLPHLSSEQVAAAFRYWHDHPEEVKRDFRAENEAEQELRQRFPLKT